MDIASGRIRSTVKVGREPEGVRVHPDGGTVWVTGETDHNVTVVDTRTGKVTAFIPDNQPDADKNNNAGSEGIGADAQGNVYSGEVSTMVLKKYAKN